MCVCVCQEYDIPNVISIKQLQPDGTFLFDCEGFQANEERVLAVARMKSTSEHQIAVLGGTQEFEFKV